MALPRRFTDSFHRHFTQHPNDNLAKGVDRALDRLPDPTLEHARHRREEAAVLGREVEVLRPSHGADPDAALDLDLAGLALAKEAHGLSYTFNGRTTLEQTPTAGSDIGQGLFLLFAYDRRPPGDRLADVTARLEAVPEYLNALLGRLRTPVERWVRIDEQKVAGLASLFDSLAEWADAIGWADRARLAAARNRADAALDDYRRSLAALPTTETFAVGSSVAERIIALRGIELSPASLLTMARTFLEEVSAALEELRSRLVAKYALPPETTSDDLHVFLNRRFRLDVDGDFGRVIERYERELESILAFNEERALFPIFDDQAVRILKTPPFMEPSIPAGAMMSPAPFREGTRESLVYLTLSEALLDEHTELTIPSMMIHEGIPGHHLQLATASLHESVVRRHVEAMDQAEGWTTLLEDYMLDAGYAPELADEVRFCAKRDISRLGARVAIDLFFMTGDRSHLEIGAPFDRSTSDPFAAAGSLLRAVTGFVPERVEAELNWYSQERGYPLSYLTGNRLAWQLKRDVERHLGGDSLEADRRFFRAYLEAGNMPLAFLRRHFAAHGLVGS